MHYGESWFTAAAAAEFVLAAVDAWVKFEFIPPLFTLSYNRDRWQVRF